jgi:hypothetical protein
MVKDPRSPKPGSSEPEEALDLLRALARARAPQSPRAERAKTESAERAETLPAERAETRREPPAAPPPPEDEKLDALRALAETLDRQLRGAPAQESRQEGHQAAHPYPHHDPHLDLHHAPDAPPPPVRERGPSPWSEFRAALPSARTLVPHFGITQIAFVAIAATALAVAALAPYIVGPRPATVLPPTLGPPPTAQEPPPPDLAAVKKAMSDCDAAASHERDSLNFLVLPLLSANARDQDWRPVALQTIGNAYMLLGANDALDGLRDGKLVVRPGRYTFSVLDTSSGMTYSWTSATGMARLERKDSGAVKTLKLGFDFSDTQSGPQWSADFKRDPGACYWVVVLVRK